MTLTSSTPAGVSRRGFLGHVTEASTLVAAVDLGTTAPVFGAHSRISEAIKAGARSM